MNCNEATMLVASYADGELDGLRKHSIEKHLRSCPHCAAAHEGLLALRARLRSEVPYFAAPPGLQERMRALGTNGREIKTARPHANADRWRWLAGGALAGCAATLLAWVIGTAVLDWRANRDLAAEAVSTHVRATLNNHLVEVASSDQHTVKPWLSARLDYSPPVQNLASDGFPLIGGRLDMLGQRQVATLVYRYRNHTIDVFVRAQSPHAPPASSAIRGFNVAQASGSGWDWLAVSDVSPDVLTEFVEKLAARTASP